ncbi:hypothetical protein Q4Q49_09010 [Shewanella sp. SP1S1-7]|uniref:DUF7716 domain-containing protein n=1 Tax=Shewanella TaxID=22 RepID=UPI0007B4756C|nr:MULTISPECIES: hypothetical protein [Shewanella]KZK71337.1 hypothetical protein A1L58_10965 [Shewanella baltica]MDT3335441.1 hypothetical protein [Shewanella sp. SP1S1-7]
MDIGSFLGESEPLKNWINKCIAQRGLQYWLVYQDTVENEVLQLATLLLPIVDDMRDWSNEEIDEFEDSLINNGYCYLLNMDQIEDVIDNYQMQKDNPTDEELLEAIIFYYERDAFMCL